MFILNRNSIILRIRAALQGTELLKELPSYAVHFISERPRPRDEVSIVEHFHNRLTVENLHLHRAQPYLLEVASCEGFSEQDRDTARNIKWGKDSTLDIDRRRTEIFAFLNKIAALKLTPEEDSPGETTPLSLANQLTDTGVNFRTIDQGLRIQLSSLTSLEIQDQAIDRKLLPFIKIAQDSSWDSANLEAFAKLQSSNEKNLIRETIPADKYTEYLDLCYQTFCRSRADVSSNRLAALFEEIVNDPKTALSDIDDIGLGKIVQFAASKENFINDVKAFLGSYDRSQSRNFYSYLCQETTAIINKGCASTIQATREFFEQLRLNTCVFLILQKYICDAFLKAQYGSSNPTVIPFVDTLMKNKIRIEGVAEEACVPIGVAKVNIGGVLSLKGNSIQLQKFDQWAPLIKIAQESNNFSDEDFEKLLELEGDIKVPTAPSIKHTILSQTPEESYKRYLECCYKVLDKDKQLLVTRFFFEELLRNNLKLKSGTGGGVNKENYSQASLERLEDFIVKHPDFLSILGPCLGTSKDKGDYQTIIRKAEGLSMTNLVAKLKEVCS